ncbi:MAG: hypothetical protein LQ340_003584 [Diploschistes diacapsis]|nr:MAG: hypothetical protein LQ340_003584 [Diploschistes diacapsis]
MALVETNSDVEAVVVSPPLAEAVSVTVDSDPLAIVEIVSTEVRPTDSVEIVKIPMVVICVIELIDAVGVVVALADAEAEGYAEFSPKEQSENLMRIQFPRDCRWKGPQELSPTVMQWKQESKQFRNQIQKQHLNPDAVPEASLLARPPVPEADVKENAPEVKLSIVVSAVDTVVSAVEIMSGADVKEKIDAVRLVMVNVAAVETSSDVTVPIVIVPVASLLESSPVPKANAREDGADVRLSIVVSALEIVVSAVDMVTGADITETTGTVRLVKVNVEAVEACSDVAAPTDPVVIAVLEPDEPSPVDSLKEDMGAPIDEMVVEMTTPELVKLEKIAIALVETVSEAPGTTKE